MTTFLKIDASANVKNAYSRFMSHLALEKLKSYQDQVLIRDLYQPKLPMIDENILPLFHQQEKKPFVLNRAQENWEQLSSQLIEELFQADIILLSSPMYNFTIPATLKNYIDLTVRVKKTFRYTEKGAPQGLLKGKTLYCFTSSGGIYSQTPMQKHNYLFPYLQMIFQFIGIENIYHFPLEGTALRREHEIKKEIHQKIETLSSLAA